MTSSASSSPLRRPRRHLPPAHPVLAHAVRAALRRGGVRRSALREAPASGARLVAASRLLALVAIVCARTAAMVFNRLVDRRFDATNPRTRGRASVTGAVSAAADGASTVARGRGFVAAAVPPEPAVRRALVRRARRHPRLLVHEARHLACPLRAGRGARRSRRSGPTSRPPGRSGRAPPEWSPVARRCSSGRPDSTSSMRARTSTTIARRACTASRRASAIPRAPWSSRGSATPSCSCSCCCRPGRSGSVSCSQSGSSVIGILLVGRAPARRAGRSFADPDGVLPAQRARQRRRDGRGGRGPLAG